MVKYRRASVNVYILLEACAKLIGQCDVSGGTHWAFDKTLRARKDDVDERIHGMQWVGVRRGHRR